MIRSFKFQVPWDDVELLHKRQNKNINVQILQQNAKWATYKYEWKCKDTSHQTSIQNKPRGKLIAWINCPNFSSPGGKTTIFIKMYFAGYTNSTGLPMYKSTRQDEDDYKKLTKVMQYLCCTKDLTLTIEAGHRGKLVGWQFLNNTPWHAKSQWHKWHWEKEWHIKHHANKNQYKKLNKSITGGHWSCYGPNIMDLAYPRCTRFAHTYYNNIPRQQEYHNAHREWHTI